MGGDYERFSIDFKRGNHLDERLNFLYQGRGTHVYVYPSMLDFTPTGLGFPVGNGKDIGLESFVIGEVDREDDLLALPAEPELPSTITGTTGGIGLSRFSNGRGFPVYS